jgi:hypothetical protein
MKRGERERGREGRGGGGAEWEVGVMEKKHRSTVAPAKKKIKNELRNEKKEMREQE